MSPPTPSRPAPRPAPRPATRLKRRRSLLGVVAVHVLTVALNLVQSPGLITFDSKLDLQLDPVGFLQRASTVWNADSALGGLENQAYGFLFPIGPWFALGELAGVPVWVWERLWSAVVMLVAFEGARRLARATGTQTRWGELVVGLAYMLAPRVVTTVGALTGETLPTSVLPWTVLPLVLARRGVIGWRGASVMSAATLPFMGGQNATEVIAALVLPGLVVLTAPGTWVGRVTRTLGWSALVVLACAWWIAPLLVLGQHGPPFLDWIESARNTTDVLGWVNALRGTDHWVAFLPEGSTSGWRAGWSLTSEPLLLVTTTAAALCALVGLARHGSGLRAPLVCSLVVGLGVLTAGSGTIAASPLGEPWLALLDGPLAPFRNIHKFDPLVRLPLALGLGWFVVQAGVARTGTSAPGWASRWARARAWVPAAAVVAVVAGGLPILQGELRDSRGFTELPPAWTSAAEHLRTRPGPVRVLVAPGAGFAIQDWGRTVDEPLQVLEGPAWVSRNQTPIRPAASIRALDGIERLIAAGRPDPALPAGLARMGITHVLVRNDLDRGQVAAPAPEAVAASMQVEGLRPDGRWGTTSQGLPQVQVYEVVRGRGDPRIVTADARWALTVSGGPESVPGLLSSGVLQPGQAALVGTEHAGADVVTDTPQRRERSFGRTHDAQSAPLARDDEFRVERAAHDYLPPSTDESRLVTADYADVRQVLASSSSGYADTLGAVRPEESPAAALDDDPGTSWASAPFSSPRGQWIEVRCDRPQTPAVLGLDFDTVLGADVTAVRVRTEGGEVAADLDTLGDVTVADLPVAQTSWVQVVVEGVRGERSQVRLASLRLDGAGTAPGLALPSVLAQDASLHLRADPTPPACSGTVTGFRCDAPRTAVSAARLRRTVQVEEAGRWDVTGQVLATGPDAVRLFEPVTPASVSVRASSTFADDPAAAPANVLDGDPLTAWVSGGGDDPVLELAWGEPRTLTRIGAARLPGVAGLAPRAIEVRAPGSATQVVELSDLSTGIISPVTTDRITLRLLRTTGVGGESRVGVSELLVEGIEDLRYAPSGSSSTGAECGLGPQVTVGGRRYETAVSGTLEDVRAGGPLDLVGCGGPVVLGQGPATITADGSATFRVSSLALVPEGAPTTVPPGRQASVETWTGTHRSVLVGPGRAGLLGVRESEADGWVARLDGNPLDPVVLDGWMQGWQVPAGEGGVVELTYQPARPYAAGLAAGGLLALVLVLMGAVTAWRSGRGAAGVGATEDAPSQRLPRPAAAAGLVGVGLLLSVPFAAGAVVGAVLLRRRARIGPFVAVAGVVCLALAVPALGSSVVTPSSADLVCAVVVGAVVATTLGPQRRRDDDV